MEVYQLVWGGEGDGERRELVKISTRRLGPPDLPSKGCLPQPKLCNLGEADGCPSRSSRGLGAQGQEKAAKLLRGHQS